MKKIISYLLTVLLLCGSLAGLTACGEGGKDANTFSWFLAAGGSKYDQGFQNNAGVQWLESKEYAGAKLKLEMMMAPRSSSPSETMQTLIASGDYPDIIDAIAVTANTTIYELYKDGIVMDLTPYVKQYMPNYLKYLEDNPDVAPAAYTEVDGERLFLTLQPFDDKQEQNCWTYMYRRDWIVKYGKHPVTGAAFTGGYDASGVWSDDIIFPNGENVPIYLSDWMWMFDIFEIARADLGLVGDPNSYCISIPYTGVETLGGLTGAFNVNSSFYLDNDGVPQYGGESDNLKVYFAAMNDWYQKGYLDKTFYERASDPPYGVNTSATASGKIGMTYEGLGLLGSSIKDDSDPLLNGLYYMAARPPINDIYGKGTSACYDAETNPFHNNNLYCFSKVDKSKIVLSVNAEKKNLEALFTMFDYMYTDEWALIHDYGLNAEQQAVVQNSIYIDHGVTTAWEYLVDENGDPILNENGEQMLDLSASVKADNDLAGAVKALRLFGKHKRSVWKEVRNAWDDFSYAEMMNYKDSGYIQDDALARLSTDMSQKYGNVGTFLRTEAEVIQYKYVTGELDPFNDDDWKIWTSIHDQAYRNTSQTIREAVEEVLEALKEAYGV